VIKVNKIFLKVINFVIKIFLKVINFFERATRQYKTEWVEDLPEDTSNNTVYIIGGRENPFYAALTCPHKRCKKIIHLQISPQFQRRWQIREHEDGALTLNPSIDIIDSSCRCHYWIKKGHVVWCDIPPLFVPKENQIPRS